MRQLKLFDRKVHLDELQEGDVFWRHYDDKRRRRTVIRADKRSVLVFEESGAYCEWIKEADDETFNKIDFRWN